MTSARVSRSLKRKLITNKKRKSRRDETSLLSKRFLRDYAAVMCMQMHCVCKTRGGALSKQRCLDVVNKKIIGHKHELKL